jgi:hypothetical protein
VRPREPHAAPFDFDGDRLPFARNAILVARVGADPHCLPTRSENPRRDRQLLGEVVALEQRDELLDLFGVRLEPERLPEPGHEARREHLPLVVEERRRHETTVREPDHVLRAEPLQEFSRLGTRHFDQPVRRPVARERAVGKEFSSQRVGRHGAGACRVGRRASRMCPNPGLFLADR